MFALYLVPHDPEECLEICVDQEGMPLAGGIIGSRRRPELSPEERDLLCRSINDELLYLEGLRETS